MSTGYKFIGPHSLKYHQQILGMFEFIRHDRNALVLYYFLFNETVSTYLYVNRKCHQPLHHIAQYTYICMYVIKRIKKNQI